MPSLLIQKLRTSVFICLLTGFAGVMYQLIDEKRLDFTSVLVGLPLGLVFSLLELFLLPPFVRRWQQWSFTRVLVIKTVLYTAIIFLVTVLLLIVGGLSDGRRLSELPAALAGRDYWV